MTYPYRPFSVRYFALPYSSPLTCRAISRPLIQRHPLGVPVSRPLCFGAISFCSSARHRLIPSNSKLDGIKWTFHYPPLNKEVSVGPTIRLLILLPGSGNELIQCQLSVVPLSSSNQYEAISYCWGDPEDTESIICNSVPLTIPWNLGAALKGLRFRHSSRVLWADSICINQSSTTEKDDQVQLMRDIFSRAHRTLIWLGTADDKHEEGPGISPIANASLRFGLAALRWLTRSYVMPSIQVRDLRHKDSTNANDMSPRMLAPFSAEFYLALVRFLRRPWFRRAW
jgi:heterokaryon incompatibility protein (HET)